MANDITLSKGVRSNLLSLQNTAELLSRTQERLSTGKKVNTALDDPINFFTSAGLSSRANDLSRLLDSVGNAVQTLAAADKGITAISKLIESAQATARQALTAAEGVTTFALGQTGSVAINDDTAATFSTAGALFTGNPDWSSLDGQTVTITVDGQDFTHTFTNSVAGQQTDFVNFLDGIAGISASVAGNNLTITADDNTTPFEIDITGAGITALTGLSDATYSPTNTQIAAFTGQMTFQIGTDPVQSIEFGNGAMGEITTRAALDARLAAISATMQGVTLSINGSDFLNVASTSAQDITIGGATSASFGITNNTYAPTSTTTSNNTRTSLQTDFNNLLQQITRLAQDASYNGVNLLSGDDLQVIFNEDGSSALSIGGVDLSATGLGLTTITGPGFQSNANVNDAIAQLDAATATLRSQASRFGSNLSIVQARQDFTKNLVAVLQTGADNLVLADTNEEGANMLALQTRQQLSSVALSMASEADQNVLRLFQ